MVRLILLCTALGLLGCQPAPPEIITFAIPTAPRMLDPRLASDAASERVNALLYAALVTLDEHGRPQPGMATWRQVEPKRYRVTLVPDRRSFADGPRPTADDVAATYRSVLAPNLGSPHASALGHIEAIEVRDATTVDFVLSRADPQFPSRLTIGIVPQRAIVADGPMASLVGSGTFGLLERNDDGSLLLERRRDRQRVRLLPTADPTMRVLKLLRGEAQLLQNDLPAELYGYLGRIDGVTIREAAGITFAYLGFNLEDPALRRLEVRRAIAHAIDRDAIIRHLFDGRASPAESVLRPSHWAGAPDLTAYAYDPGRARALLAEAGYSADRPLRLNYKTSTDPFRLRIAHVFQQQFASVGIELTISSYDWGTFFGDIKAGRFQLYSLAWVGVNTPDILRYAFHSDSRPPGGANRGHYRSAAVDRLIEQAEQLAPRFAAPLYRAAQRQIHNDLVYVPLWYEKNVSASRRLTGYAPAFDGSYLALNQVELDRAD